VCLRCQEPLPLSSSRCLIAKDVWKATTGRSAHLMPDFDRSTTFPCWCQGRMDNRSPSASGMPESGYVHTLDSTSVAYQAIRSIHGVTTTVRRFILSLPLDVPIHQMDGLQNCQSQGVQDSYPPVLLSKLTESTRKMRSPCFG
jgi:hypothetical protein